MTRHSQLALFKDLSSSLAKYAHMLAIDTTNSNLEWWAREAPSFKYPVALVHSLETGTTNSRQESVPVLLDQIRDDLEIIKEISDEVPVAVTWDASINACSAGASSHHDCSLDGQLSYATGRKARGDEKELNDITEGFAKDILSEMEKVKVPAWFFRTAKLQTISRRTSPFAKRRVQEGVISGNNFLSLYEHGMITDQQLSKEKKKGIPIAPIVWGLGAVGAAAAGAAAWHYRDDMKKAADDLMQSLQPPVVSTSRPEIVSPGLRAPSNHPVEAPTVKLPSIQEANREASLLPFDPSALGEHPPVTLPESLPSSEHLLVPSIEQPTSSESPEQQMLQQMTVDRPGQRRPSPPLELRPTE